MEIPFAAQRVVSWLGTGNIKWLNIAIDTMGCFRGDLGNVSHRMTGRLAAGKSPGVHGSECSQDGCQDKNGPWQETAMARAEIQSRCGVASKLVGANAPPPSSRAVKGYMTDGSRQNRAFTFALPRPTCSLCWGSVARRGRPALDLAQASHRRIPSPNPANPTADGQDRLFSSSAETNCCETCATRTAGERPYDGPFSSTSSIRLRLDWPLEGAARRTPGREHK